MKCFHNFSTLTSSLLVYDYCENLFLAVSNDMYMSRNSTELYKLNCRIACMIDVVTNYREQFAHELFMGKSADGCCCCNDFSNHFSR
mgnify:CR=1 FL=1